MTQRHAEAVVPFRFARQFAAGQITGERRRAALQCLARLFHSVAPNSVSYAPAARMTEQQTARLRRG